MDNEKKVQSAQKVDKTRFALWIRRAVLDLVDQNYEADNCKTKSEFIEKAIQFYCGYLASDFGNGYLPNVESSMLRSMMQESDAKRDRMLFKIAVELAVLENVIAATNEVDKDTLSRLRGECLKEVKRTHGTFSFEDAVEWQE